MAPDLAWPWWLPELTWPSWSALLGASVGYIVLTMLWTWPMVLVWQHGVIVPPWNVDQPDVSQNVWNLWHLINTWQSGNPLLTTAVFYPQQLNLMYQSYGLAQAVLVLPIVAVWGPIAGANAILALGYWGGAFGVFVLIWALSKRPGFAFVVGWIYAITPAHQYNVAWAADENAALQWIVLLHISIIWWLRQPNRWRWIAPLGMLVINTLASGYFGLFGAVYLGLMVLWSLWYRWIPAWHVRILSQSVLIAVLWVGSAVALLAPPLAEYPYADQTDVAANPLARESDLTLADWYMRQTIATHVVAVSDLVLPTQEQPWWRWLAPEVEVPGSQMGGYLGWSVLLIVAWGMWHMPSLRPMLGLAGLIVLLAAGLEMRLWPGQPFPALPGPFWVLNSTAVFRNASRPGLFLLWAWLPLVLVLAQVLVQTRGRWMWLALALLVWGDFMPFTWTSSPQRASAAAPIIKHAPDDGAVLYLPFEKNGARPLLDQVCHGRASATGYMARVPARVTPMRHVISQPDPWQDVIPVRAVDELANLGIRYVVVSPGTPTYSTDALQVGGASPWAQSGADVIWRIPDATTPALVPGSGWWDPEQNGDTRWRWSGARSTVQIIAVRDSVVRIGLTMSRLDASQPLQMWVNGVLYQEFMVPSMPVMLERTVIVPVQAGRNDIVFVTGTTTDPVGREIGVSFSRIEISASAPLIGGTQLPAAPTYARSWLCDTP